MHPRDLDQVISDYEEILECIAHGRNPDELRSYVVSTTRWLSFLSVNYLSDGGSKESRQKIEKAFALADQCSEVTDTISDNHKRIWDLRQQAEIFRAN